MKKIKLGVLLIFTSQIFSLGNKNIYASEFNPLEVVEGLDSLLESLNAIKRMTQGIQERADANQNMLEQIYDEEFRNREDYTEFLENKTEIFNQFLSLLVPGAFETKRYNITKNDLIDEEQLPLALDLIDQTTEANRVFYHHSSSKATLRNINEAASRMSLSFDSLEDAFSQEGLILFKDQCDGSIDRVKKERRKRFREGKSFHHIEYEINVPSFAVNPQWLKDEYQQYFVEDSAKLNVMKQRQRLRSKLKINQVSKAVAKALDVNATDFFSALTRLSEDNETGCLEVNQESVTAFQDSLEDFSTSPEPKVAKSDNSAKKSKNSKKRKSKQKIKKSQVKPTTRDLVKSEQENIEENEQSVIEDAKEAASAYNGPNINVFKPALNDAHSRLKRWIPAFNPNRIIDFRDGTAFQYMGLDDKELFEQWVMHQGVHFISIFENDLESLFAGKYFIKMVNDDGRTSYVAKAIFRNLKLKSNKQVKEGFLVLSKGDDGETWIHAKFQDYSPRISNLDLGGYINSFFGPANPDLSENHMNNNVDEGDFVPVRVYSEHYANGLITLKLENAHLSIIPK